LVIRAAAAVVLTHPAVLAVLPHRVVVLVETYHQEMAQRVRPILAAVAVALAVLLLAALAAVALSLFARSLQRTRQASALRAAHTRRSRVTARTV
jgi:cytochrome c biogenesis protein CcdA